MSPSSPPPPPPRCPSSSPWPPWPPTPLWRPFNLPGRQEAPTGLPARAVNPRPGVCPLLPRLSALRRRPGRGRLSTLAPASLRPPGPFQRLCCRKVTEREREKESRSFPVWGGVWGPFPTPPSLFLLPPLLALVCVGAVLWPSPILFSPCCSVGLPWSVPPPPPPLVQPSLVYEGEEGRPLPLPLPAFCPCCPPPRPCWLGPGHHHTRLKTPFSRLPGRSSPGQGSREQEGDEPAAVKEGPAFIRRRTTLQDDDKVVRFSDLPPACTGDPARPRCLWRSRTPGSRWAADSSPDRGPPPARLATAPPPPTMSHPQKKRRRRNNRCDRAREKKNQFPLIFVFSFATCRFAFLTPPPPGCPTPTRTRTRADRRRTK